MDLDSNYNMGTNENPHWMRIEKVEEDISNQQVYELNDLVHKGLIV